jgi:hypothetical protein
MILYIIWILLSISLSIYGLILSYPPILYDDMYPLFHNITTVLFLYPSYFIISFGVIPHLILSYINNKNFRLVILIPILTGSFIYSFGFLEEFIPYKLR